MMRPAPWERRLKRLSCLLPGLLASLLVIALMQIHAWAPLERKISDQMMRWRGSMPWDEAIVAIKIDDKSLSELGSFPLSNSYYADLVEVLRREGTSVVAFSMVFPADSSAEGDLDRSGAAEARLAAAMAAQGRVAIGQTVSIEGEPVAPNPVLAKRVIATGHLRSQPDSDGITRWVSLTLGNVPTLGVAAIQAYSLENRLIGIPPGMSKMRLHWPGPAKDLAALSLIDVLEGNFPAGYLRGKIAIVGYVTTASDMQLLRTPFDDQVPVLADYLHAVVVHDLLQQSWLRSPPRSGIMLSLLFGGAMLSGLLYQRPAWIKVTATLGLVAGWMVVCFLALKHNYLLPTVAPVVNAGCVGASVMLLGRLQSSAMLQARSAFLNTISHEIRTPLNAIVNLSEMLQGTPLNERQHEFVDSLNNSSQTLLALINDILDFSKIESERLVLEDYPVNLPEIIERSLEMLAPRAAEKNIELVYAIAPQTPAVILSDPVRLQQILLNLISNAVKFTEVGEVSVTVEAVPRVQKETWRSRLFEARSVDVLKLKATKQRLFYGLQQGFRRQSKQQIRTGRAIVPSGRPSFDSNSFYEIRFAIKDTGIGIPADRISELFKPFSQLSPATTRKYGGTGLGLAISQRLSERMGGRLWVKSQVGKGSTFHFSIRAHLAHPQPALPAELLCLNGARILLVDRSKVRRDRLIWELFPFGIQVEQASSMADAMAALQAESAFDAIVLDSAIAAPDRDCRRVVEALRQAADLTQLPIILLSALRSHLPNLSNPPDLGNTVVLWKPVKQSSLYQALQFICPNEEPSERSQSELDSPDNCYMKALYPHEADISPTPRVASSALLSDGFLALPGIEPQRKLVPSSSSSSGSALRILIAEDNRINQRVALRMLELIGYKAQVVSSGKAVLETLKHQQYDVILMDMRMPEMDGLETTRRIRQLSSGQAVWIIAMTANAMAQDRERCLQSGMNDYLSKPIHREALDRALERCLAMQEMH